MDVVNVYFWWDNKKKFYLPDKISITMATFFVCRLVKRPVVSSMKTLIFLM